jgi:hypothetical protein
MAELKESTIWSEFGDFKRSQDGALVVLEPVKFAAWSKRLKELL